ncbi:pirin family protein [Aureivirga sp. CE67]|uniref:pirin family protein n=1 Tax=Aureivirga sp. CE67 TaxID=1788983 RepID=UPI0018C974F2|nr:pirin family protein [Aureivirga sp. CE67]
MKKNIIIHKAESRGNADYGWLKTSYTFSFANYFNQERINFGALRVLNDDIISGGMGFDTHPHRNMEIISIPLKGEIRHKDNMSNEAEVIKSGDIQVMSAGTGITHSEFNNKKEEDLKLLQIWVFPNKKNVAPRYDQTTLKEEDRKNKFQQIVSPNKEDEGVWIHQNAWFHLGIFETDSETTYSLKDKKNGLYIFVISGKVQIENQILNQRDGMGITDFETADFKFLENNSEVLLMEVPMDFE